MIRALVLSCLSVSLLASAVSKALADNSEPTARKVPELKAYRINPHPPVIDGVLDDAIWDSSKIQKTSSFTQREPDDGKVASESTTVAVAYDDDAVYVAFWCYDSEPDEIKGQLVRRDRDAESDRVTFRVDPFHDHQTGNAFEVSAAGVQRDCRYYNENMADMSWDAVWESGVSRQPWGWSAELRIPLSCLRFANKEEQVWGADFQRYISRKYEFDRWAYVPLSQGGFVSNFGHLTDLKGIRPSNQLELLPYAVSSVETEPSSPGNPNGRDLLGNTGFDLKYGLSSDLVLDATVNPDFGQVELDQPVINLTTYETFFEEKRPFFLEGSDLFQTDFMLFYSRRIGRAPFRGTGDDEFAYYEDYPKSTTILGATKLTGRLSGRTSIALLSAVTQEEVAKYAAETNVVLDSTWNGDELVTTVVSADTVTREAVVEPSANYTALRIKRDIFKNSSIGGLLTLVGQKSVHPAMTGGMDWRLSTNNSAWIASGQAVFSRVNGDVTGYGLNASFEKAGGKHVRGAVGFTTKDPYLQINRLGYTSRNNTRHVWAWVQYMTTDDWWIIRNSYHNLNQYTSWNFDGVRYEFGGNYNTYIEFKNFWSFGGGFNIQGERYSDDETRGYGLWEWPVRPTFSWWADLETDQRKRISFEWNPGSGTDRSGSWWANYVGFEYRPRSNMEFSLGANYAKYTHATRWVTNDDDAEKPVFGDLYRESVSLYASGSVVVNRDLSIQLSAQGLLSGLDYRNYRYYLGGQNYSDPLSGFNSDYNYSALNSTLLLRWEYRPGSTLYMVWTRSRPEIDESVNNFSFSRDFKRLFSNNSQNVFLVKASYWLSI